MITKWRYVSKAYLRDGDAGKFRDSLGGHELILEVFATGSAISSWTEETSHIAAKSSGCMSCSSNDGLMVRSKYNTKSNIFRAIMIIIYGNILFGLFIIEYRV